jgi:hypothetical protein
MCSRGSAVKTDAHTKTIKNDTGKFFLCTDVTLPQQMILVREQQTKLSLSNDENHWMMSIGGLQWVFSSSSRLSFCRLLPLSCRNAVM